MNKLAQQFGHSLQSFVDDEEGAQVIEYALIIALVSIALALALRGLTANGGSFSTFITRVGTCLGLTSGTTC
ncbi:MULTISPECIES: Flp family type IVb pilin [Comamonas]|jgi:pilus assembly protein Flp/PilA|uniref:Pilus subunit protein PilA n=2 Tax=Comamonas aquatica TaxID=225991 RepID=A0A014MFP6_9BURK|nr:MULTISPECIES: Flp family type IVb pilin [Comamonas]EXU80556.1 pilus subunit protein PilA [Comamonas aquatica DA1877]MRT20275.1 Flp family type IVb pilin [Comamonas sp. CAH-2]CAB5677708.1 Flp pilus assembly protein, pilin Flp [Comamonas aquatica]CAB5702938.1 Flp pilus assembly protein, pilin Flp [Comamonas aquatica]CAC9228454.1 Flp pilus assembly protein, pilin Flp [Comamonas aquatica]